VPIPPNSRPTTVESRDTSFSWEAGRVGGLSAEGGSWTWWPADRRQRISANTDSAQDAARELEGSRSGNLLQAGRAKYQPAMGPVS